MKKKLFLRQQRGVTLIELLVVLVMSALVIGGIYRIFIAQTKAYTVQDQVVEMQQTLRSAMELMIRDLRMTGFDDDGLASTVTILNPIVYPVSANSITINYEYYDAGAAQYQQHTVTYWRDAGTSTLQRQRLINGGNSQTEVILENVEALTFTYGVDVDEDGVLDAWRDPGAVGTTKIVAVQATLTARPESTGADDERFKGVTPRTLTSAVTFRNLCLVR